MVRRRRFRYVGLSDDRGAVTVENIILFPFLLLMILFAVQLAVFFHARGVITAAARVGLDTGRAEQGSELQAEQDARDFLDESGGGLRAPINVDVDRPDPADPDRTVESTVGSDIMWVFPLDFPGFGQRIEITVSAPLEEVQA